MDQSHLHNRSGGVSGTGDQRPPAYKAVGISLAIASGVFIGVSFVLKKMGLLRANVKYNEEAGEGYGYLKNAYWWGGMTLMIIGEICNFVAYAFVDAILVTPLGALSVVITTILSAIFLKERLSFVGKIGCFLCIVGSVVIVMNAPSQSSAGTIQEMQRFVIAPGFLVYAGLVIIGSAFVAFWAGPRYGKKSMMVYLSICSLIGGLSVVATQGLGAAVVAQAAGKPQFNQWFLYVLLVFVIATLVTEIIYLNKALNLFNAALVTPTYYVFFTSATIVTSAILFQGFKGTPTSIVTVCLGFLTICSGVVLLQLSKSAKDVPDAAVFTGDLNQVRTVAEQEEPESEPKADAIRGTAAIMRRLSNSRAKAEASEAKRVYEDRLRDQMEPINEHENVQWDGLRRRKTIMGPPGSPMRQRTIHPPLGMAQFPDLENDERPYSGRSPMEDRFIGARLDSFRRKTPTKDLLSPHAMTTDLSPPSTGRGFFSKRPTEIIVPSKFPTDKLTADNYPHSATSDPNAMEMTSQTHAGHMDEESNNHLGQRQGRPIMWADGSRGLRPSTAGSQLSSAPTPPAHTNRRQFSFQNVFSGRNRGVSAASNASPFSPSIASVGGPPSVSSAGVGGDSTVDDTTAPNDQSRARQAPFGIVSHSRGSSARDRPTSKRRLSNRLTKNATEEERLGLVKGDDNALRQTGSGSDTDHDAVGLDSRITMPNAERGRNYYQDGDDKWKDPQPRGDIINRLMTASPEQESADLIPTSQPHSRRGTVASSKPQSLHQSQKSVQSIPASASIRKVSVDEDLESAAQRYRKRSVSQIRGAPRGGSSGPNQPPTSFI